MLASPFARCVRISDSIETLQSPRYVRLLQIVASFLDLSVDSPAWRRKLHIFIKFWLHAVDLGATG
jgi:hypothetical protein